jgi:hypothetical protein
MFCAETFCADRDIGNADGYTQFSDFSIESASYGNTVEISLGTWLWRS